jgi:hypothetical protein
MVCVLQMGLDRDSLLHDNIFHEHHNVDIPLNQTLRAILVVRLGIAESE